MKDLPTIKVVNAIRVFIFNVNSCFCLLFVVDVVEPASSSLWMIFWWKPTTFYAISRYMLFHNYLLFIVLLYTHNDMKYLIRKQTHYKHVTQSIVFFTSGCNGFKTTSFDFDIFRRIFLIFLPRRFCSRHRNFLKSLIYKKSDWY